MNITSLIKITSTVSAVAIATVFTSCVQPVAPQQPNANSQAQGGANPYAVPGLNGQTPVQPQVVNPTYPQNPGTAPYQPLPGVPSDPAVLPTPPAPNINIPAQPAASAATSHDVIAGESLWRISRKYGVSIEAIQQANGLKTTDIWAGQKLVIPAGN